MLGIDCRDMDFWRWMHQNHMSKPTAMCIIHRIVRQFSITISENLGNTSSCLGMFCQKKWFETTQRQTVPHGNFAKVQDQRNIPHAFAKVDPILGVASGKWVYPKIWLQWFRVFPCFPTACCCCFQPTSRDSDFAPLQQQDKTTTNEPYNAQLISCTKRAPSFATQFCPYNYTKLCKISVTWKWEANTWLEEDFHVGFGYLWVPNMNCITV